MNPKSAVEQRTVVPLSDEHRWAEEAAAKQRAADEFNASIAPPTEADLIKLGDLAKHFAPFKIDAAGLAELGFNPVRTQQTSKLYDRRELQSMVMKGAERLFKNRTEI